MFLLKKSKLLLIFGDSKNFLNAFKNNFKTSDSTAMFLKITNISQNCEGKIAIKNKKTYSYFFNECSGPFITKKKN